MRFVDIAAGLLQGFPGGKRHADSVTVWNPKHLLIVRGDETDTSSEDTDSNSNENNVDENTSQDKNDKTGDDKKNESENDKNDDKKSKDDKNDGENNTNSKQKNNNSPEKNEQNNKPDGQNNNENQKTPKSKTFKIHITDKELLQLTGGIVQGMSGTLIVQGDKIIGAISHAVENDPTTGYAVFIKWMIEE